MKLECRRICDMSSTYVIHESEISHNSFDDEVIVVNLATGSYFSLHDAGAGIWRMLQQGPASAASLVAAFESPPREAKEEIQAFLDQLAQHQLIVGTSAPAVPQTSQRPYATPTLEEFDELRELLLADIIHDTDQHGWPHVAPPLEGRSNEAA
jgi:hypothetical protein